jgi:hypothetical protein
VSDTKKPREFWIKDFPLARTVGGLKVYDAFDGPVQFKDNIHVIEYSAVEDRDKVIRELAEALELVAFTSHFVACYQEELRLSRKQAEEALEQYADAIKRARDHE